MADKKPVYIRCPRCELNYCLKKDKICSVCKAEIAGDKEALIDELELELCPICKTNYIQPDEIMCATCLKERQASGGDATDVADDWDAYVNRDEDEDITTEDEETGEMASISELDDDVLSVELDDDLPFDIDDDMSDMTDEQDEDNDDDENDDDDDDDDFETLDEDDLDLDEDDLDDDDDYIKPKRK